MIPPKVGIANMLDVDMASGKTRVLYTEHTSPKRPDGSVHEWLMESETQHVSATCDEFANWVYARHRQRVRASEWFNGKTMRFMAGVVAKEFTTEELDAMYAMWVIEEGGEK